MTTSVPVEIQVSHVVPNLQVATAEVARKPNQSLQPPVRTSARSAAVVCIHRIAQELALYGTPIDVRPLVRIPPGHVPTQLCRQDGWVLR
jgi:hypothetical protein